MTKKKGKSPLGEEVQIPSGEAGAATPGPGASVLSETPKKSFKDAAKGAPDASPQALIICRNK